MEELDEARLAQKLAELRKARGWTQKELANKLFISDRVVSKWECGVSLPDIRTMTKLASIYGVGLDELAGNGSVLRERNRKAIYTVRLPQSALSLSIEILTAALFVFAFIWFWRDYQALPDIIAIHFSADGAPNGWGAKHLAWLPLGLCLSIGVSIGVFQLIRFRPSINLFSEVRYLDEMIPDDGCRRKLLKRFNLGLSFCKLCLFFMGFFPSFQLFGSGIDLFYLFWIFFALLLLDVIGLAAGVLWTALQSEKSISHSKD